MVTTCLFSWKMTPSDQDLTRFLRVKKQKLFRRPVTFQLDPVIVEVSSTNMPSKLNPDSMDLQSSIKPETVSVRKLTSEKVFMEKTIRYPTNLEQQAELESEVTNRRLHYDFLLEGLLVEWRTRRKKFLALDPEDKPTGQSFFPHQHDQIKYWAWPFLGIVALTSSLPLVRSVKKPLSPTVQPFQIEIEAESNGLSTSQVFDRLSYNPHELTAQSNELFEQTLRLGLSPSEVLTPSKAAEAKDLTATLQHPISNFEYSKMILDALIKKTYCHAFKPKAGYVSNVVFTTSESDSYLPIEPVEDNDVHDFSGVLNLVNLKDVVYSRSFVLPLMTAKENWGHPVNPFLYRQWEKGLVYRYINQWLSTDADEMRRYRRSVQFTSRHVEEGLHLKASFKELSLLKQFATPTSNELSPLKTKWKTKTKPWEASMDSTQWLKQLVLNAESVSASLLNNTQQDSVKKIPTHVTLLPQDWPMLPNQFNRISKGSDIYTEIGTASFLKPLVDPQQTLNKVIEVTKVIGVPKLLQDTFLPIPGVATLGDRLSNWLVNWSFTYSTTEGIINDATFANQFSKEVGRAHLPSLKWKRPQISQTSNHQVLAQTDSVSRGDFPEELFRANLTYESLKRLPALPTISPDLTRTLERTQGLLPLRFDYVLTQGNTEPEFLDDDHPTPGAILKTFLFRSSSYLDDPSFKERAKDLKRRRAFRYKRAGFAKKKRKRIHPRPDWLQESLRDSLLKLRHPGGKTGTSNAKFTTQRPDQVRYAINVQNKFPTNKFIPKRLNSESLSLFRQKGLHHSLMTNLPQLMDRKLSHVAEWAKPQSNYKYWRVFNFGNEFTPYTNALNRNFKDLQQKNFDHPLKTKLAQMPQWFWKKSRSEVDIENLRFKQLPSVNNFGSLVDFNSDATPSRLLLNELRSVALQNALIYERLNTIISLHRDKKGFMTEKPPSLSNVNRVRRVSWKNWVWPQAWSDVALSPLKQTQGQWILKQTHLLRDPDVTDIQRLWRTGKLRTLSKPVRESTQKGIFRLRLPFVRKTKVHPVTVERSWKKVNLMDTKLKVFGLVNHRTNLYPRQLKSRFQNERGALNAQNALLTPQEMEMQHSINYSVQFWWDETQHHLLSSVNPFGAEPWNVFEACMSTPQLTSESQSLTINLVNGSLVLLHIALLSFLIQLPETRTFLKFYLLVFTRVAKGYLWMTSMCYSLLLDCFYEIQFASYSGYRLMFPYYRNTEFTYHVVLMHLHRLRINPQIKGYTWQREEGQVPLAVVDLLAESKEVALAMMHICIYRHDILNAEEQLKQSQELDDLIKHTQEQEQRGHVDALTNEQLETLGQLADLTTEDVDATINSFQDDLAQESQEERTKLITELADQIAYDTYNKAKDDTFKNDKDKDDFTKDDQKYLGDETQNHTEDIDDKPEETEANKEELERLFLKDSPEPFTPPNTSEENGTGYGPANGSGNGREHEPLNGNGTRLDPVNGQKPNEHKTRLDFLDEYAKRPDFTEYSVEYLEYAEFLFNHCLQNDIPLNRIKKRVRHLGKVAKQRDTSWSGYNINTNISDVPNEPNTPTNELSARIAESKQNWSDWTYELFYMKERQNAYKSKLVFDSSSEGKVYQQSLNQNVLSRKILDFQLTQLFTKLSRPIAGLFVFISRKSYQLYDTVDTAVTTARQVTLQFMEEPADNTIKAFNEYFFIYFMADILSPRSDELETWNTVLVEGYTRQLNAFGPLGSLAQRRVHRLFDDFYIAFTKPDMDLLLRHQKSLIFWDMWGALLIRAIARYELSLSDFMSTKEEQDKLLECLITEPDWSWTQESLIQFQPLFNLLSVENRNWKAFSGSSASKYLGDLPPLETVVQSHTEAIASKDLQNLEAFENLNPADLLYTNNHALSFDDLSQRWGAQQTKMYHSRLSTMGVEYHPSWNLQSVPQVGEYFGIHTQLGWIIKDNLLTTFTQTPSKNALIVGPPGPEVTSLIRALVGELELKFISDSARRYTTVIKNIAIGVRHLKEVFYAVSVEAPCLFVLEDIHLIGQKRDLLIAEDEELYLLEQDQVTSVAEDYEEDYIIDHIEKHTLLLYEKPFRGDYSFLISTNCFAYDYFFEPPTSRLRQVGRFTASHYDLPAIEHELVKLRGLENLSNAQARTPALTLTSGVQARKPIKEVKAAPNSPLTVAIEKNKKAFRPRRIVKNMPLEGISWDMWMLLSRYDYSIRSKVALLAVLTEDALGELTDTITDLLVMMDTVRATRGLVMFATTHAPTSLDPALRRPGRLDETLQIPVYSTVSTRWQLLKQRLKEYDTLQELAPYGHVTRNLANYEVLEFALKTTLSLLPRKVSFQYKTKPPVVKPTSVLKTKTHVSYFTAFLQSKGFHALKEQLEGVIDVPSESQMLDTQNRQRKFQNQVNTLTYTLVGAHLIRWKAKVITDEMETDFLTYSIDKVNPLLTGLEFQKQRGDFTVARMRDPLMLREHYTNSLAPRFAESFFTSALVNAACPSSSDKQMGSLQFTFQLREKNNYVPLTFEKFELAATQFKSGGSTVFNATLPAFRNNLISVGVPASRMSHFVSAIVQKRLVWTKNTIVHRLLYVPMKQVYREALGLPVYDITDRDKQFETLQKEQRVLYTPGNLTMNEKMELHKTYRLYLELANRTVDHWHKPEELQLLKRHVLPSLEELSSLAFVMNHPTGTNKYYRQSMHLRQRFHLIDEWWNGHLEDFDVETALARDVETRTFFVEAIGNDVEIDYPQPEKYYNVRSRRWMSKHGNETWFLKEAKFNDAVAYHYMVCALTRCYGQLNMHRESLDHLAYSFLKEGTISELEAFSHYTRFDHT